MRNNRTTSTPLGSFFFIHIKKSSKVKEDGIPDIRGTRSKRKKNGGKKRETEKKKQPQTPVGGGICKCPDIQRRKV